MELYSLVRGHETIGYRVVIPELRRAYDVNENLFMSYASGVLDLSNLKSLFVHKCSNGKWCTEGEESREEGITTYLELIYDSDVCNLVDILSSARNCVFRSTCVEYEGKSWVVEDVDLSQGIFLLSRNSGIARDADGVHIRELLQKFKA